MICTGAGFLCHSIGERVPFDSDLGPGHAAMRESCSFRTAVKCPSQGHRCPSQGGLQPWTPSFRPKANRPVSSRSWNRRRTRSDRKHLSGKLSIAQQPLPAPWRKNYKAISMIYEFVVYSEWRTISPMLVGSILKSKPHEAL